MNRRLHATATVLRRIGHNAVIAIVLVACAVAHPWAAFADTPQAADSATANAIKHWQDLRFGMFIHWGPVALRGTEAGWSRGREVPAEEYDQLYKQFDPTEFNADHWVALAKSAGMQYIVFTTKHHDGFCMWPTKFGDYDIGQSPFRRDVVGELAAACRRGGIQFSTYYSLPDWHSPDYALHSPGGSVKNPTANMARHVELVKNQTRELVENYGPLGVMWFDGDWEEPWTAAYGDELYDYLKGIQPSLIINNRVSRGRLSTNADGSPAGKGDFDTPEQHVGDFDRGQPWESCITLGQNWNWKQDEKIKSLKTCIQTLLYSVGGDGNLLLNVGPMPTGEIELRQASRLREIGAWLAKYGGGVYGSRGGPFIPGDWGVSTCKGDKIYLYIMDWPGVGPLLLPGINQKIVGYRTLSGGEAKVVASSSDITVDLSREHRNPIATVIELTVSGKAFDISPAPVTLRSGSLAFDRPTTASNVFDDMSEYDASRATDDDRSTRWATDAVTAAWLEVDLGELTTISRIEIDEPEEYQRVESFQVQRYDGRQWHVLVEGDAIGTQWVREVPPTPASRVRLIILQSKDGPTIDEFRVFSSQSEVATTPYRQE